MASHASAIKKNRQDQKRRLRNRMHAGKLHAGQKVRKALVPETRPHPALIARRCL
jgi:ribosomal protein S20